MNEVVINLDPNAFYDGLMAFLELPPATMIWRLLFWYYAWVPVAIVYLWGVKEIWMYYINNQYYDKQKFIVLAIDIPRNNAQSLLAVENLFTYLAGAHGNPNKIEIYWDGAFQLSFSVEIISIDGYIQFLIRTPQQWRNLVETAVYSQYPDAEIYEVEDYVNGVPSRFPDEEWDMWGAEIVQTAKTDKLPIRTYPSFEHNLGEPETHFRDPMASLMDLMSSLKKGEQLWYQIWVQPTDVSWVKKSGEEIDKILGAYKQPVSKTNEWIDYILEIMGNMSEAIYSIWGDIKPEKKADDPLKMMNLKPDQKIKIEAIQAKLAKLGFNCKMRMMYVAKKDVMNKPKVASGFMGYMKQFASNDLNGFKPHSRLKATTSYFMKDSRLIEVKNTLMSHCKSRSSAGADSRLFNTEELATIWHFPFDMVVKAPLIQKASARRVEPPMTLPFGENVSKDNSLEPIFDNGYVINDLNQEAVAEQIITPIKNDQPGFMNEEDRDEKVEGKIPTNLPFFDDTPEVVIKEKEILLEDSDLDVKPKDKPPVNLPFA